MNNITSLRHTRTGFVLNTKIFCLNIVNCEILLRHTTSNSRVKLRNWIPEFRETLAIAIRP